jgi:carboxymethylenebutenolidase
MADKEINGFWVRPEQGSGKALLVLHAWWGLNETIKGFCRRFGDEGYTVFAPDLYEGKVTDRIPLAEKFSNTLFLDYEGAFDQVQSAAKTLLEEMDSSEAEIGLVAFSMGAPFALELSITMPEVVKSVVVFYGSWAMDYSTSEAAYLGHFAGEDEFEPGENVQDFRDALTRANRPARVFIYPGTGHWFMEPDRLDYYNEDAAELAWERTLAFLNETL